MAVIHKHGQLEGAAACGCNVFKSFKNSEQGERKVSRSRLVFFENEKNPATCKRCLGNVARPITLPITEDMVGKVFHRSFGYDMTFNVFAKVLRHTAKGLLCQECFASTNGDEHYPGGSGRATAGDLKPDAKPFVMLLKRSQYGHEGWSGGGEGWTISSSGQSYYENHCD